MTLIDGVTIQVVDIADAYCAAFGWNESQRRSYLANLTLLSAIVPRITGNVADIASVDEPGVTIRSHAPEDVLPGVQYDPLQVCTPCGHTTLWLR